MVSLWHLHCSVVFMVSKTRETYGDINYPARGFELRKCEQSLKTMTFIGPVVALKARSACCRATRSAPRPPVFVAIRRHVHQFKSHCWRDMKENHHRLLRLLWQKSGLFASQTQHSIPESHLSRSCHEVCCHCGNLSEMAMDGYGLRLHSEELMEVYAAVQAPSRSCDIRVDGFHISEDLFLKSKEHIRTLTILPSI